MSAPSEPTPKPPPADRPADRQSWAANLALAGLTVGILFFIVEVTLRLTGFEFVLKPEDIEFGRPHREAIRIGFQEDPDLFWVPKRYGTQLERLKGEKPPWLLIGDSCVQLSDYDLRLAERAAAAGRGHVRYGNLAVAGWSSFQGRQQVRRDLPDLEPKLVTLSYGWNDHWIGFGLEDKTVAQTLDIFSRRWSELRWVQLLTRAVVEYRARETNFPNRVSLEDFEANMLDMVAQLREMGAVPVILTAASNHRPGEEPEGLARRWLRDLNDLIPLHRAYVETQRRAAEKSGAPLCDLAASFEALDEAARRPFFMDDGIHYTPAGSLEVARLLDLCFERHDLWRLIAEPTGEAETGGEAPEAAGAAGATGP